MTFLIDQPPPLLIARLRARGQLTELRQADLSFTPDEAATVLSRSAGLDLSGMCWTGRR